MKLEDFFGRWYQRGTINLEIIKFILENPGVTKRQLVRHLIKYQKEYADVTRIRHEVLTHRLTNMIFSIALI